MKSRLYLLALICAIFTACGTGGSRYTPPPDQFSGIWIDLDSTLYMHIIEEVIPTVSWKGTFYIRSDRKAPDNWVIHTKYTIEKSGDEEYRTSTNWHISSDGDILTVERMKYKRVLE